MKTPVDEDLKARLLSDDLEVKAIAMKESAELVREILHTAMRGILVDDHAFALSDEMAKFGPIMVDGLGALLKEAPSGDSKVHIALLLLIYGSQAGVEIAIEEIRTHGPAMHRALNQLGQSGIDRAAPVIMEKLRALIHRSRFDEESRWLLGSLTTALKNLGIPLPEDLHAALREEGVPWLNRMYAGVLNEEEKEWPRAQQPAEVSPDGK